MHQGLPDRHSAAIGSAEASTGIGKGHANSVFSSCCEVGEHAAGTAIRCLDWCEWPVVGSSGTDGNSAAQATGSSTTSTSTMGPAYMVVTGGAKEVMMAWQLQWQWQPSPVTASTPHQSCSSQQDSKGAGISTASTGTWRLEHRWVGTRPPPRYGLRPKPNKGSQAYDQHIAKADKRFMAVQVLPPPKSSNVGVKEGLAANQLNHGTVPAPSTTSTSGARDVLVVAATSDASLSLYSMNLSSGCTWHNTAQLQYHTHPVISLAKVSLGSLNAAGSSSNTTTSTGTSLADSYLVFSGATDGSIAAWLISHGGGMPGPHPAAAADALPALEPVLPVPGAHQSGVNGLAVSWWDPSQGLLALVSAGDDQSLVVTQLRCNRGADQGLPLQLEVLSQYRVCNAHSSALKDVCFVSSTDSATGSGQVRRMLVATTGLDQRVRLWGVEPFAAPEQSAAPASTAHASSQHTGPHATPYGRSGLNAVAATAAAAGMELIDMSGGATAGSSTAALASQLRQAPAGLSHPGLIHVGPSCSGPGLKPPLALHQLDCVITEVLEPCCLSAAEGLDMPSPVSAGSTGQHGLGQVGAGNARAVVAVAGRGVQLLSLTAL